ncbi:unnamed protein product [Pleuronectes platessa]|uniref:Uncharacterized protein n=1 Tax=Pleuronectes platessa TaxID=8262 RepID=A0A9N7V7B4_PLEPL|nr:unnamed protein product [Pleuronectes platessa]
MGLITVKERCCLWFHIRGKGGRKSGKEAGERFAGNRVTVGGRQVLHSLSRVRNVPSLVGNLVEDLLHVGPSGHHPGLSGGGWQEKLHSMSVANPVFRACQREAIGTKRRTGSRQ